jgi:hypothetical protein
MNIPLKEEFLLISGATSFLVIAKAMARFPLCIETAGNEYIQTLDSDDLIAASAPEGGDLEPALMLIEFVRKYRMPLMVLAKDHPGSKRFRYVVSAGPVINTSCSIRRGTHPEQHLICSHDELAGIVLTGIPGGLEIDSLPPGVSLQRLDYQFSTNPLSETW